MAVEYLPAQIDSTSSTVALTYTSSPFKLLWADIKLFFKYAYAVPGIVVPLGPYASGPMDELYPSWANIFDIVLHSCLIVIQLVFLLWIPLSFFLPIPIGIFALIFAAALYINHAICLILNGSQHILDSNIDLSSYPNHDNERWVFLNGVAVGRHWLQSNVDRLSVTFGRKVVGIHGPTKGIIFDVIECLIQRDFSYSTMAIRNCYAHVKGLLMNHAIDKVVFILHSQGGIEGGMVLDWLLADLPEEILHKLEIYTFGCAANHFNNPIIREADTHGMLESLWNGKRNENDERVIRHIEHYANSDDFVSKWGVLEYADSKRFHDNRFAGRLFKRDGSGHQLNQHYLDSIFPLVTPKGPVDEDSGFMNMLVKVQEETAIMRESATLETLAKSPPLMKVTKNKQANEITVGMVDPEPKTSETPSLSASAIYSTVARKSAMATQMKPVKELSRLWKYRNGESPKA